MTSPGHAYHETPLRPWTRRLIIAAFSLFVLVFAAVIQLNSMLIGITNDLPATPDLDRLPVSVAVIDRNAKLLRPFTTADGRWRLPVDRADVDPHFIAMLLAYEDRGFASHNGIAWSSMFRAAAQFVAAGGHVVSGGSTLTMQVARLVEGEPTRNLWGKLRQMVHADQLEHHLSKDQIA
ncbi:transglycosylase domain-containing protein [Devosia algicola]|uniref:Transglycosylase domain-containing protein n=1 Tax=Devosia algicola TaxID=3026418 RepID=A0ABY7YPA6_9HYPH|nr:transglycosylase domain-containing protein [Devosia algicola]WDR03141.1 transglycosylase domain-containing protein [Devosia algicola]